MAPLKSLILVSALTSSAAFAPTSRAPSSKSTALNENFGFDFAEDMEENTPSFILGEANLKEWVEDTNPNSFLNRQYDVVRRVRELDILGLTAEYGILSKLEKNGLDLATIESLLPSIEGVGALSIVGSNQQLLVNGIAPLLVEAAPLLLPVVAGALDIGPLAFFAASAGLAGVDVALLANDVQVPFIGLPAGVLAGLLLVPLSVVTGGVGVFLSSLKK